jgi:hypothetical protein
MDNKPDDTHALKTLPSDVDPNDMTMKHVHAQDADAPTLPPLRSGTPPPANAIAAKPAGFGDYQIVREIARGGMGVVYEARHCRDQNDFDRSASKPR